jgi:hypothetical protein
MRKIIPAKPIVHSIILFGNNGICSLQIILKNNSLNG